MLVNVARHIRAMRECIGMWGRLRGITCERQPYLLVDADDVLKFECLGIVLVVPTNDDNPVVSRVIDL